MDERKFIIIAAIALILVLGAGFIYWAVLPKNGREITASGTIEATEVVVSSKVSGTVLKLVVSEGDRVRRGDLLAQIDNAEANAVYDQANGALLQAQANLELAGKNYERAQSLFKDGFTSQQGLDQARASLDAAAGVLKQAEASLELTKIRLKDSTITSPVSGFVTVKSVEEGELLSPGSPVATITDLANIHMMVYVSEKEVGRIKLGDGAYIFSDSYPNQRFLGRVTYISKQAEFTPKMIQTKEERVTQVFGVKVEVPNPDLKLKPGLPADALIKI